MSLIAQTSNLRDVFVVHPVNFQILYAPELLRAEFKSEVADMKNSVKDRGNAQASCAVSERVFVTASLMLRVPHRTTMPHKFLTRNFIRTSKLVTFGLY